MNSPSEIVCAVTLTSNLHPARQSTPVLDRLSCGLAPRQIGPLRCHQRYRIHQPETAFVARDPGGSWEAEVVSFHSAVDGAPMNQDSSGRLFSVKAFDSRIENQWCDKLIRPQ